MVTRIYCFQGLIPTVFSFIEECLWRVMKKNHMKSMTILQERSINRNPIFFIYMFYVRDWNEMWGDFVLSSLLNFCLYNFCLQLDPLFELWSYRGHSEVCGLMKQKKLHSTFPYLFQYSLIFWQVGMDYCTVLLLSYFLFKSLPFLLTGPKACLWNLFPFEVNS